MLFGHRILTLERGAASPEGYRFPMVLATEGEASDGHILELRGGTIPDPIPLQLSHVNDPTYTLGSVTTPRKELRSKPPRLRAQGLVETDRGEGEALERRRDVAEMIDAGHVRAVSIRWQGEESIPRRNLPEDHPHYVAEEEKDFSKRYGLLFRRWTALEGSVVAVGADSEALIGRARAHEAAAAAEAPERAELAAFWRDFAQDVREPSAPTPLERIAELVELALELGTDAELPPALMLESFGQAAGGVPVRVNDRTLYVPSELAGTLAGLEVLRQTRASSPRRRRNPARNGADAQRVADATTNLLAKHRAALKLDIGRMLERATGRRIEE